MLNLIYIYFHKCRENEDFYTRYFNILFPLELFRNLWGIDEKHKILIYVYIYIDIDIYEVA